MSLEVFGDEGSGMDPNEADALIDAGWLTPEDAEAIKEAVSELFEEPIYEVPGKLSIRFLMRMSILRYRCDLMTPGDPVQLRMLEEAMRTLKPVELPPTAKP